MSAEGGGGGRVVRVIEAYEASRKDPIVVREGERVLVGRRDVEYPGWAWCTGPDGREGWTPERFLCGSDGGALMPGYQGKAVAAVDYDAHELTVEPGDELVVIGETDGWLLGERGGDGGRGWVPAAAVAAPLAQS